MDISPFLLQQGALALQTPAVAGEGAVLAYSAVAGDDDRHRIRGAGAADGADGFGVAEAAGDLGVGAGAAGGDGAQLFPDAPLERRRLDVEGQVEVRPAAVQV